jgi:hypothetical protein
MVAVTLQEKSKTPSRTGVGLLALSPVLALSTAARASSDEPAGINLGGSSFMDGFGRTDPVFVYQQYFQIERYDAINDQNGRNLPEFQGVDINAVTSLNQFIYVSPFISLAARSALTHCCRSSISTQRSRRSEARFGRKVDKTLELCEVTIIKARW